MVRTKVFVGNLDFQTKETELVSQFSQAGKVISANIITRGPRSLGYGFVEMDSEEDANKAVQLLNKKEIDGRPVNVEVAKPRDETKVKENDNTTTDSGAPRGSSRGRGRGGRPRGRGRGGRGFGRGNSTSSFRPRGTGQAPTSPKQQNSPKSERVQEENRTPSKTMLFVANLPFKLDDDTFAKVFKDAGLNYKAAHVVKNQRSGRSKGFGFVEFENEADQQKALNTVNKKVVDERELIVKVALTENKPPEQQTATPNKQ